MGAFRAALLLPGQDDPRTSVIDDLATYFGLSAAECLDRCVNWEKYSLEEWYAAPRDTTAGIHDFYANVRSWAFDLLWFAYLQAEGYAYPVSVVIARAMGRRNDCPSHLDFGSGVGVTSQLFAALGYETTLADVSTPLLEFASFRLERRGLRASYLDLSTSGLPRRRFSVVTAIDTLVHVPEVGETSAALHRAIEPHGVLWANFDTRPKTYENAWHLYADDLPLRWKLHRAGFEPRAAHDGMITRYERIDPATVAHRLRGARDAVLLRGPARPAYRRIRHRILPAVLSTLKEPRERAAKRGGAQEIAPRVER